MSTRIKEIIVVVAALAFCLTFYIGKTSGWGPVEFSPLVSGIVMVLLALSLIWILVMTIQGKLIERRVVFLYVGVAVALPLFMTITQKIAISPEVRSLYDSMEQLQPGSKILVSFDYDPPSAPELQPMAESVIRYCFERDLKVVIMGLWPQGPQQANLALDKVLAEPEIAAKGLKYGIDYVNLGFQTGNEFVIQRMGADFSSMFSTDYAGTPYKDLPLVRNVKNFSNIDYGVNLSAGFPGSVEWVQIAVDRYGLPLGVGNTAVQAPQMYAYLDAGQLTGILGGMSGGAEFEKICNAPAKATKFMLSQSFAHMVVIAFVIIGNIAFFKEGRKTALKG